MFGAGEGNRTLVSALGRPYSTIEPHPLPTATPLPNQNPPRNCFRHLHSAFSVRCSMFPVASPRVFPNRRLPPTRERFRWPYPRLPMQPRHHVRIGKNQHFFVGGQRLRTLAEEFLRQLAHFRPAHAELE